MSWQGRLNSSNNNNLNPNNTNNTTKPDHHQMNEWRQPMLLLSRYGANYMLATARSIKATTMPQEQHLHPTMMKLATQYATTMPRKTVPKTVAPTTNPPLSTSTKFTRTQPRSWHMFAPQQPVSRAMACSMCLRRRRPTTRPWPPFSAFKTRCLTTVVAAAVAAAADRVHITTRCLLPTSPTVLPRQLSRPYLVPQRVLP